ncbi:MAG: hypothetical protein AB7K24_25330 [Gemmataceae bacterium]
MADFFRVVAYLLLAYAAACAAYATLIGPTLAWSYTTPDGQLIEKRLEGLAAAREYEKRRGPHGFFQPEIPPGCQLKSASYQAPPMGWGDAIFAGVLGAILLVLARSSSGPKPDSEQPAPASDLEPS